MYEQQRQVLQVSVNSFESHRQAAAFMVGIARQYCNGEVDKATLKELRDRTIPNKAGVSKGKHAILQKEAGMQHGERHAALQRYGCDRPMGRTVTGSWTTDTRYGQDCEPKMSEGDQGHRPS